MTNDNADIMNALITNGSCQLPLPGIPYGFVVVPLDMDAQWVSERMKAMMGAFHDAGGWSDNLPANGYGYEPLQQQEAPPLPPEPDAPRPQQRPQQAAQPPQQTRSGNGNGSAQGRTGGAQNAYGVTLYCPRPECDQAVLAPSVKNKNMDFVESIQREIPASWWHTDADGKSCSTYQSRAIWGPVVAPAAAAR